MKKLLIVFSTIILWSVFSCKQDTPQESSVDTAVKAVTIPSFTIDSAYAYVAKQVEFGPRNPNSAGHEATKNWIAAKCKEFGAQVIEQPFSAQTYTGVAFEATNIIAQINPNNPNRVLLAAHWDTRFIAEQDSDEDRKDDPIPGADDGASGVGVLLEVLRTIQNNPIELGVDVVFFDAEDQGERGSQDVESWCLGAQYWSKNPHNGYIQPKFGILLDMVGGRNARFAMEDVRQNYEANHARKVNALYSKVWKLAQSMGKGNYFASAVVNGGIDDHYFVNKIRKIPMIDIINKPANSNTSFMEHWHTHGDDIQNIDRRTLRAVGQVVLAVLYKESGGSF